MKWTKVRYIHLELERQNKCQKVENLLKVERAGIQEFHTHTERQQQVTTIDRAIQSIKVTTRKREQ